MRSHVTDVVKWPTLLAIEKAVPHPEGMKNKSFKVEKQLWTWSWLCSWLFRYCLFFDYPSSSEKLRIVEISRKLVWIELLIVWSVAGIKNTRAESFATAVYTASSKQVISYRAEFYRHIDVLYWNEPEIRIVPNTAG